VLPGTRVDVIATVNPTQQPTDITSKVILTKVLVLAAGTKIERDAENNKPIQVNVVTLLVNPDEAERLTLASTEGKILLALRNPMDQTAPNTPGVRPAGLMGSGYSAPVRRVAANTAAPRPEVVKPAPLPTVEIIRGDKRAQEAVAQE
jgi:pilus assembly protein CpaB